MISVRVPITTNPQSLFILGAFTEPNCIEALIQSPSTNTNIINFGGKGHEVGELLNGGAAGLTITNLKNVFVKGTPTDEIIILVF